MPGSYIASLRLAQMQDAAKHYDDAIAACDRGMARNPGALGQAWLLLIKADALQAQGKTAEERKSLELALQAAQQIPATASRDSSTATIKKMLAEIRSAAK
jgi:predicted negative regulator of RcsB-dependent stress response